MPDLLIKGARPTVGALSRSHRNFVHPKVVKPITISGKDGDDAKYYQEKAVVIAIKEAEK